VTAVPVRTVTAWSSSWARTRAPRGGVDGRQDFGELLDLGDGQPAGGQCFGHFQADVPGADDNGAARFRFFQGAHDGEGVVHRVQQVHAVGRAEGVQAGDRRADGDRAGADDELVVGDGVLGPVVTGDVQQAAAGVDRAGGGVQPQPHPGCFQVTAGAVGQVAPVADFPRDVVRDAADGEVRVGVRAHHGDLGRRVDLAGPQRGADARVTASDGDDVHGICLSLRAGGPVG
jgi:hypothetical protein